MLTFRGHTAPVWAICSSPDGKRLATASEDGTAKVWDARTGQEILTLSHTNVVRGVSFSPDGRRLATASDDGTAKVWDVETEEPPNNPLAAPGAPADQLEPPPVAQPNKPPALPSIPKTKVSLKAPYPQSNRGAPTDKISVQYAVIEILKQAGVEHLYDFQKSQANVGELARRWITPHVADQPCDRALDQILGPLGLTYEFTNGKVVLKRK